MIQFPCDKTGAIIWHNFFQQAKLCKEFESKINHWILESVKSVCNLSIVILDVAKDMQNASIHLEWSSITFRHMTLTVNWHNKCVVLAMGTLASSRNVEKPLGVLTDWLDIGSRCILNILISLISSPGPVQPSQGLHSHHLQVSCWSTKWMDQ